MARFNEEQFYQILDILEQSENRDEDIWTSVGVLEMMYDDDYGWIDEYFHMLSQDRRKEVLWKKLQDNILRLEYDKIS